MITEPASSAALHIQPGMTVLTAVALVGANAWARQVAQGQADAAVIAAQGAAEAQISCVVAPAEDDRLALAARAAGIPVHVQANPKVIAGEAIAEGSDLIVAAHTHARVSDEALAMFLATGGTAADICGDHGPVGRHADRLPRDRVDRTRRRVRSAASTTSTARCSSFALPYQTGM